MNTTASLLLRGEHPAPFYVAQLAETLPRKGWLLLLPKAALAA